MEQHVRNGRSQEYRTFFEEPMHIGARNVASTILGDTCNRYQAQPLDVEDAEGKVNWVLKCEIALATYFGQRFGLGVSTGGIAIMLGLKAMHRVLLNDRAKEHVAVYSNSFTFNAVPSAIVNAGFSPTFIQTSRSLTIDLDDLERQAKADLAAGIARGSMILVLSYMRGRVPDMDRVLEICKTYNILLLEDNAHGYGVEYNGRKAGSFGLVSTISMQSSKLINTGEGGFVFTSCDRIQAYLMVSAGCYEQLPAKHESLCPSQEAIEEMILSVPNFSCRLTNIQAALAFPQIEVMPQRIAKHNSDYVMLERLVAKKLLDGISRDEKLYGLGAKDPKDLIEFIPQHVNVSPVHDSLQVRLPSLCPDALQCMIQAMNALGYKFQAFGRNGEARYYRSWQFCVPKDQVLKATDCNLEAVCDMRLPVQDTPEDIERKATALVECFLSAVERSALGPDGNKRRRIEEDSVQQVCVVGH
mmetsp:Transcript_6487/g.10387  ORF Transcript_6487/g.10387 Transcript_6487/m.10387 type:complete len:472 (+) Transcript_6487:36-1451(+)